MQRFHTIEIGKGNNKIIFLLAGWHNRAWMFWFFAKIFQLNGFHCILYEYHDDVLSPDTKKTVNSLKEIRDDILRRIKKLKQKGDYKFAVFGTSLGSVIALMVADKSPEITHLILNTVGDDIAETIWSWDKIFPYFKERLHQQNYNLEKLKIDWSTISPKNNIDNLSNKKLLIYLSEKDEVIPFYLGERLVSKLKNKNYSTQVNVIKHLNHLLTGLFNLLNARIYLQFLN